MKVLSSVNFLAAVISAIIFFFIGFIWYSFLFNKIWVKEKGLSVTAGENKMRPSAIVFQYFCTLIFLFLYVLGLAIIGNLIGKGIIEGLKISLFAIICLVVPFHSSSLFFPPKPKLFLIDGGYYAVGTIISAVILSIW